MWKYLTSEIFQTRYAIAAFLFRDCEKIIEIGGYKTPISNYTSQETLVIDPYVEPSLHPKQKHIQGRVQDVEFKDLGNYGLLVMGMDLDEPLDFVDKLAELVNNSKRAIIEFPVAYERSTEQFKALVDKIRKPQYKMEYSFAGDFGEATKFTSRVMHIY